MLTLLQRFYRIDPMEHISDYQLIIASHPSARKHRDYLAVYSTGKAVLWNVANKKVAKRYATEYGVRFLEGAKVLSLLWLRDNETKETK